MVLLLPVSCRSRSGELTGKATNTYEEMGIQGPIQKTAGLQGRARHNNVPGEVMVTFTLGVDKWAKEAIRRQLQLTTIAIVPRLNAHRMRFQGCFPAEAIIKHLQGFMEAEYAEPYCIAMFKQG